MQQVYLEVVRSVDYERESRPTLVLPPLVCHVASCMTSPSYPILRAYDGFLSSPTVMARKSPTRTKNSKLRQKMPNGVDEGLTSGQPTFWGNIG
jgi:hypothetical protein